MEIFLCQLTRFQTRLFGLNSRTVSLLSSPDLASSATSSSPNPYTGQRHRYSRPPAATNRRQSSFFTTQSNPDEPFQLLHSPTSSNFKSMPMASNREYSSKSHRPFFGRSISLHPDPNGQNLPSSPINKPATPTETLKGKVSKLRSLFESSQSQSQSHGRSKSVPEYTHPKLKPTKLSFHKSSPIVLPGTEDRIVVYFTSLRGVRRTFDDCYSVRMIFRGFRLCVDERDVSLDSAYRKELLSVLGEKQMVPLPQVFIRGKHVGGADSVMLLHETGELADMVERFPKRAPGFVCRNCGDVRFVPCINCSGSRKVFDDDEGVLKRCWCCNENGLIRCSDCNNYQ